MKKWLRSVFKTGSPETEKNATNAPDDGAESRQTPADATPHIASPGSHPEELNLADVLGDLKRFICANSADPLVEAEIDTEAHLYDAGYVTSITAADLLVHIESRYGVIIPDVDLVGRMDNLGVLAAHIISERSGG